MSRKNTIKFTESELKRMIAESVKRIIKEEIENNRPLWRGVPGAYLIDDDYIEYNGMTIDKYDLEDTVREWLIDDYQDMMDRPWFDSTDIFDEYDSDTFQECLDAYCDQL
jgi:hypothetical protein